MGNDQRCNNGSSSSSSSKKNKSKNKSKSSSNSSSNNNNSNSNSNSEKPKQPQRGLGVAQLEKIRLHTQMANCGFFPQQQFHHPGFPNGPFPSPIFPHVHEDMRMQAGYQAAVMQPPTTPFGFGPASCSASQYGYHHPNNNFMMGVGEHMERTCSIRFGESHPPMTTRWNPNNNVSAMSENQQYMMQPQGLVTRHLLSHVEENTIRDNSFESNNGSCSHNSESSSGNEEPDLDLKLSL